LRLPFGGLFVYNALLHLKYNAKASVKGHSQIVVEFLGKGELE